MTKQVSRRALATCTHALTATLSPTRSAYNGHNNTSLNNNSTSRVATLSEMFQALLQNIEQRQAQYHGHLIRDKIQACFKGVMLEEMSLSSFYGLMDCWAKLTSQKSFTATCGGNQVGISAHGMLLVCRNPS